ncbi:MAG: tetrahydromethanopterin S-methyltransferase subunit H [Desulfurococcaceae archaeon]|jgi:tetrahydromethanopterin S-methyltransferase subunit H|nr:tetrahydromethanopterin S-methyltransferase subunit H [Desulfurococcaceae archaeon]
MFRYSLEQKVFEIKGIKVGSQPGENPPILIGSIFYHKHKIVEDEKKGVFRKEEAEKLIKNVEELSDRTKIPFMLDVVGASPEAIVKYIEFVSSITKAPILVDPLGDVNVASVALRYVKEVGLIDRVIYNSLTAKSRDEEYKLLQESGVDKAVLLLYTDKVLDVEARIKSLEMMLEKTRVYGVDKYMVDTFVIDLPSLSVAMRTAIEIKKRFGLPVGCGAHNAISAQRKAFKERFGSEWVKIMELASNLAPIVIGSDFLLYGPIETSNEVFAAVYTIYSSYRYLKRFNIALQL